MKKKKVDKLERAFMKIYREEALIKQAGTCKYCHERLTYKNVTAEHVKARSKGGLNRKENIAASCEPCNKLKGQMEESKFIKILKNFPAGQDYEFILTWSKRRINLALERLEKRVCG